MENDQVAESPVEQQRSQSALDRLRDRTDELELIISSLTIFALTSLPSWLYDVFADSYTHLSTNSAIAGTLIASLAAGLCYVLATCFVVHLMVRAYWVGLIGLRTAFPHGIRWERTPTIGPLTRESYQRRLPGLATNIESADRIASSLFAVISMLTLVMLWIGSILIIALVIAARIGVLFGATNLALGITSLVLMVVLLGVPLVIYILDAQLAARSPWLRNNRAFHALIKILSGISSLTYPERLILPVQLTLQSNMRPFLFFVALSFAVVLIVLGGQLRVTAWRDFTVSSEFTYLNNDDVRAGFRSTYYEEFASPTDRLRAWPRIASYVQSSSSVQLFIPYQPMRDNLMLARICPDPDAVADKVDCLRQLWSVSLAGEPVPMDNFIGAERADLGLRGLVGTLPVDGLAPGTHWIKVVWQTGTLDAATDLDDRYNEANFVFDIPFVFAPDFERALSEE